LANLSVALRQPLSLQVVLLLMAWLVRGRLPGTRIPTGQLELVLGSPSPLLRALSCPMMLILGTILQSVVVFVRFDP
jgi:hypothetical protein